MTEFEASLVVDWYLELEERLLSVLRTTLLTEETGGLFLPPLANIILDASSLVDTIFRAHYSGPKDRSQLKITDYSPEYETRYHLSRRRSLLYQMPPAYVEPFRSWCDAVTGTYLPIAWWQSYNSLKHDRILEYKRATLGNAVHSLCALHQVLALVEEFKKALLRKDLIAFGQWGKEYAFDAAYSLENKEVTILVETELFATPVGILTFPDNMNQIRPFLFSSGKKLWRFFGPDM